MAKMDATQKATLKTSVESREKAAINERYGMSRVEQFRAEKDKLDAMRNDKNNPISQDAYNRALSDLSQSFSGGHNSSPAPSMGIHSTTDSGEAISRLIAFRENAFAQKGDIRSASTLTRAGRRAVASKAAAIRRKGIRLRGGKRGLGVTDAGDPTEAMTSRMLGEDAYTDPLTDLGVSPEEATFPDPHVSPLANPTEQLYPPAPTYAGYTSGREVGSGYGGSGDDTKTLLERIAKAVEKESEVKIETAGLK